MLDLAGLQNNEDMKKMKNSEKIYITGHRHPDSDSIVSAIAYTELKKRKGFDAVACRLGALNPETKYLLERLKMHALPWQRLHSIRRLQ